MARQSLDYVLFSLAQSGASMRYVAGNNPTLNLIHRLKDVNAAVSDGALVLRWPTENGCPHWQRNWYGPLDR